MPKMKRPLLERLMEKVRAEPAAAAYVAARVKVLALKRERAACKREREESAEPDVGLDGVLPCRFRPDDVPCAPCVERERLAAELPKASAAAYRRFVTLRDVVRSAKRLVPGESAAIIAAMDVLP